MDLSTYPRSIIYIEHIANRYPRFITGGCVSDADCSSGCCAGNPDVGVCSAEAASLQAGKTGCGFVDANSDATIAAAQAQVEQQGFKRVVRKST